MGIWSRKCDVVSFYIVELGKNNQKVGTAYNNYYFKFDLRAKINGQYSISIE